MSLTDQLGEAQKRDLEEFILAEQRASQVKEKIHEFVDICYDKCVLKPTSRLDSSTERCLTNCVDRFIDTSLFIANRFAQRLQQGTGGGGF